MVYGITGTSRMLNTQETQLVHRVVKRHVLRGNHILASGMAWGVDTEAVLAVWGLIPFENLVCVVPGTAPHNYALVDQARDLGAKIIVCPTLYTRGETYLSRDDKLVEIAHRFLAFPIRRTFYRSGTWATINRARKAGKVVRMYPFSKIAQ